MQSANPCVSLMNDMIIDMKKDTDRIFATVVSRTWSQLISQSIEDDDERKIFDTGDNLWEEKALKYMSFHPQFNDGRIPAYYQDRAHNLKKDLEGYKIKYPILPFWKGDSNGSRRYSYIITKYFMLFTNEISSGSSGIHWWDRIIEDTMPLYILQLLKDMDRHDSIVDIKKAYDHYQSTRFCNPNIPFKVLYDRLMDKNKVLLQCIDDARAQHSEYLLMKARCDRAEKECERLRVELELSLKRKALRNHNHRPCCILL